MGEKSIPILIAMVALCTLANIGVIGVQAEIFEYHLGNYSISFELSNASGYNVTTDPFPADRNSDLEINRLFLTQSDDRKITFWIDEHLGSYPLNLTRIKEGTASGLDSQGIRNYSFANSTIDGHPGYIRHIPKQRIDSNGEEIPESYDAVYQQDERTSVQVEVVGFGEEVFEQLVGSIHVKYMPSSI